MKKIDNYILEKLHLNKNLKISSELYNKVCKVLIYENPKFRETIERYIDKRPYLKNFDVYLNEEDYKETKKQVKDLDELFDCYCNYPYIDKAKKLFINTIFFEKGLEIMALEKDGLLIKDSKGGINDVIIFLNYDKDIEECE